MTDSDVVISIIVTSIALLVVVALVVALLVLNNTRRIRHRAELAELQQQQAKAVMEAEREATQHTLREIGRELHDNVGQLLAVAQLGINTELADGHEGGRLGAARDALEQGLDEVRRLGHDLNTDLWQQRSLVDAISAEAERLERVSRVQVHLLVNGQLPALPADHKTVLFRVFQLILTNALKHSGADSIDISLGPVLPGGVAQGGLLLTIADNGRGFDPEHTQAHAGLVNIHKRCALIGYDAHCTTEPGGGCTWRLQPLPADET